MKLTERQLEAVAAAVPPRDTCVVAGPGSGKTTVLVEHFAALVQSGVDPLRILAITFTEKAANNMREKLAEKFSSRTELRARLERAYVSTVDGFCTRLLKENAVFAGLDPEFYVMDEHEAARDQRESIDRALDDMFVREPERMRRLVRSLPAADIGAEVLECYGAIRAAGVAVSELPNSPAPARPDIPEALQEVAELRPRYWRDDQLAHLQEVQAGVARIAAALQEGPEPALRAIQSFACNLVKLKRGDAASEPIRRLKKELLPELEYSLIASYYQAGRATICELFARFDRLYRQHKQQLAAVDFSDLEEYAVRLLEEHAGVRQRVRAQFDYVLMDEFQDTNGLQARLLELLRPPDRFYAVGDINQSIYGFRHAAPEVFRGYRDRVSSGGGRLVELVENFRGRPDILHAVEAVVDGAPGIEPRPLLPGLTFSDKSEPSVEVLAAAAPEIEAQAVAERIAQLEGRLHLRGGLAAFRDFAVLVRNSEVIPEFTRAFDNWGVPYLVSRGRGFYEAREVVDLMHLLRVLANPRDEISMASVLRSPFVEASVEALLRLKDGDNLGGAVERLTPAVLVDFAPDDAARLSRFREQLARWRAIRNHTPIDLLLLRAMDECGYECATGPRGTANIEKFLAQVRTAGARQTLDEFVTEIEMLRESRPREPDAPLEDSANAVKIMTVHSAKGLEFPVVFLASMHKGVDSSLGSISFSPRIGLGARWRHPAAPGDKDDSYQHAIRSELKQRENEEGHRLLYVAMTRAQEHLVLSLSSTQRKPQNWAAVLAASLHLDLETPRDEIVTITAPGGERVAVRVRSIAAPPDPPPPRQRDDVAISAQFVQRPALDGQHDSQATVTSIAMFAECPRRYYLSRYLGFDAQSRAPAVADGVSGLSASDLGRQVHALLAGTPAASPDPEAVRQAGLFRSSPLGTCAAAAATIEREFDFLMEVEKIVLRGQIDLWFEHRGKTVLVDYKTDRVSAAEAPDHAARYALQLRLYALALERLTGRPPDEAYICFLRPNVAVPVDLRPSLFDSPELAVREFREAQERQDFPLHEGPHCRTCPHFTRLCPAVDASPTPA